MLPPFIEGRPSKSPDQNVTAGDHQRKAVWRGLDAKADVAHPLAEVACGDVLPGDLTSTRRSPARSPSVGSPRASQSALPVK